MTKDALPVGASVDRSTRGSGARDQRALAHRKVWPTRSENPVTVNHRRAQEATRYRWVAQSAWAANGARSLPRKATP